MGIKIKEQNQNKYHNDSWKNRNKKKVEFKLFIKTTLLQFWNDI